MVAGLQSQQGTKHSMHLPVLTLRQRERDKSKGHRALSVFKSQHWSNTNTEEQLRAAGELHFSWLCLVSYFSATSLVWSEYFPGAERELEWKGEMLKCVSCILSEVVKLKSTVNEGGGKWCYLPWVSGIIFLTKKRKPNLEQTGLCFFCSIESC